MSITIKWELFKLVLNAVMIIFLTIFAIVNPDKSKIIIGVLGCMALLGAARLGVDALLKQLEIDIAAERLESVKRKRGNAQYRE